MTHPVVIENITIKQDAQGRYCLNDLHKAAGGENRHRPSLWLENSQTQALIGELEAENPAINAVHTVRGRGITGTYAGRELVYAYATWISPQFHLKVIRFFDRGVTQGVAVAIKSSNLDQDELAKEYLGGRSGMANALSKSSLSFTFREDGYFNMTKAAAHFGKRLDKFFASQETQDYIKAVIEISNPTKTGDKGLVSVQRGNGNLPNVGTWAHPKLAVFFARWLNVKFGVWCDSVIEDILTKKAELVVTKPQESAVVTTTQALGMNNQMMQALTMFMQASKTPHKFERVLDRASQRDSPRSPLPFPQEGRRGLSQGLQ